MDKYEKWIYMELESIEYMVKTAKGQLTVNDKETSREALIKAQEMIDVLLNGRKAYLYK